MHESIAFDLEIAKELPDNGDDWDQYRPFGISIASCMTSNWRDFTLPDVSMLCPDQRYPAQLNPEQANVMAHFLLDYPGTIVTWNGLGFDFRVLIESMPDNQLRYQVAQLAYSEQHIDLGFAMLCDLGYMCGLQAACEGMGLPGKSDGITGKLIPQLWRGTRLQQEECLNYCRNDVAMTMLVYQGLLHHGKLQYLDKMGSKHIWKPRDELVLDVRNAQLAPEVGRPYWKRSKFTGWLADYL